MAIATLGDALAESGATYASDPDPQLVRDSLPFALKLIESLLAEAPDHVGLLSAAASGFTQYAYAFVQMDADEMADHDLAGAEALRARARGLYRRARDYALRGLEESHPGVIAALASAGPAREAALSGLDTADLELTYWATSAWGLAISLSKDDPRSLAEISRVEALARRALAIDADWSEGALHEFMIALDGSRAESMGGSALRARGHFDRAVGLSHGLRCSPYIAYAESVSVRNQDRDEFVHLLQTALTIDVDARPEWRLLNLVMQRRARWLIDRADLLFAD
jgi:hypothetical protein